MPKPRTWFEHLLEPRSKLSFWVRLSFASLLFVASVWLCCGSGPIARMSARASYDWLYRLSFFENPDISHEPAVIVYVDESSQRDLQQPRNRPWDRRLYARMIDRLREDGARAVVLDVIFSGPSDPEADQVLEDAIRANGRVVLGADRGVGSGIRVGGERVQLESLVLPEDRFVETGASLGLVHLDADDDFIVREIIPLTPYDGLLSLSWSAAAMAGLPNLSLLEERWVRYYGKPETVPHVSFSQALETNFPRSGFFKDKVVFIGARPTATLLVERRDEFRSSFNTWKDRFLFMPAVEVHATMFLNLLRGDWLSRTAPAVEWICALFLSGGVFGALHRLKPLHATLASAASAAGLTFGAIVLFRLGWWTPWLAFLFIYIPGLLVGCIVYSSVEWLAQRQAFREQELAASRRIAEQAALLDMARDAIIVHDLKWNAQFWNEGAQATYGWSRDELRGKALDDLISHGSSAMLIAQSETIKNGQWSGEMKHYTRAGKEILIQSRWSLLRHDDGSPRGILMINTDVTEQRQLEAQLLRSQRLDSLGTLAGGIAHDLNNVLSPILMGVELVRLKTEGAKVDNLLNTIETSAQRGAALVKQILTFARGVEGEQKVVQLRHLLKEMDKILGETFPKNINLSIHVLPDLQCVSADLTQLHQVLLNLCVNARDAMPDGGQLKIEARNIESLPGHLRADGPAPYILIKVADTGTGIPPEIAEKIFEPFFTTKEIGKGTGLGLATVASIVRKHKGCLDFRSVVGQGTEFHLYLPAAKDQAVSESTAAKAGNWGGQGELVLVVDDEQSIRGTLEEMLIGANYQVITASHAQAAVEIVAEQGTTVSAVVMDRMMPGLDSIEALRRMKMLQPGIAIFCISGLAPENPQVLAEVCDGFLLKPFTREALLATLRSKLAQPLQLDL